MIYSITFFGAGSIFMFLAFINAYNKVIERAEKEGWRQAEMHIPLIRFETDAPGVWQIRCSIDGNHSFKRIR